MKPVTIRNAGTNWFHYDNIQRQSLRELVENFKFSNNIKLWNSHDILGPQNLLFPLRWQSMYSCTPQVLIINSMKHIEIDWFSPFHTKISFNFRSETLYRAKATLCPEKRDQNVFFIISSIKLMRFRWNLVCCFPNKFAAKTYRQFSLHLNDVSTLPCESWNAHRARATIESLKQRTAEIMPP